MKTETKHTPPTEISIRNGWVMIGAKNYTPEEIDRAVNSHDELLKALKKIRLGDFEYPTQWADIAKAAIAKAEAAQ